MEYQFCYQQPFVQYAQSPSSVISVASSHNSRPGRSKYWKIKIQVGLLFLTLSKSSILARFLSYHYCLLKFVEKQTYHNSTYLVSLFFLINILESYES